MQTPNALCTLEDLKAILNITDASEDDKLTSLIAYMSDYISTYCDRILKYSQITEYHAGDGTYELLLNQYPVVGGKSSILLYEDLDFEYSNDDLISSDNFELFATEGRIIRTDAKFYTNVGPSIKVIYYAGYSVFKVVAGANDKFNFEETDGVELTATINAGIYIASELTSEIETQLETEGASDYMVSYDIDSHKFTIASDMSGGGGIFYILWATGIHSATSIGALLGFDTTSDSNDAASHTSDNVIIAVPQDLQLACLGLCANQYRLDQRNGEAVRSLTIGDGGISYSKLEMPDMAKVILSKYRRKDILG